MYLYFRISMYGYYHLTLVVMMDFLVIITLKKSLFLLYIYHATILNNFVKNLVIFQLSFDRRSSTRLNLSTQLTKSIPPLHFITFTLKTFVIVKLNSAVRIIYLYNPLDYQIFLRKKHSFSRENP